MYGVVILILGYGIFWTVYFGIWDIAYPPNQASLVLQNDRILKWLRSQKDQRRNQRIMIVIPQMKKSVDM